MADLSRAMQTPPPPSTAVSQGITAAQNAARTEQAPATRDAAREAKNERDRLRRKAKRAAFLKARKAAAAKPKKKKAKAKKKRKTVATMIAAAHLGKSVRAIAKKRGRGRPPGAKNKPKDANDILAPLSAMKAAPKTTSLLIRISAAVSLINSLPEHARKVVLDAVK